jgi:hypothetical protein
MDEKPDVEGVASLRLSGFQWSQTKVVGYSSHARPCMYQGVAHRKGLVHYAETLGPYDMRLDVTHKVVRGDKSTRLGDRYDLL